MMISTINGAGTSVPLNSIEKNGTAPKGILEEQKKLEGKDNE